jgi:MoaA/NifB/PqqE/SkfB family radical SAM enzyme
MWEYLRIQPIASGCPNRCRHCCDEAGPPFGELIGLDDVQWIVDELIGAWQSSLGTSPQVRVITDGYEPSVHPHFVRLHQYAASFLPQSRRAESDALGTNGYGLARCAAWQSLYQAMLAAGLRRLGMVVHGAEDEHDWFVQRPGAYQDLVTATERALASGMDLGFEIPINRRNVTSFASIVNALERLTEGRARLWSGVSAFYMNDRLRALQALRPTKRDIEPLADALPGAPLSAANSEAFWTRRLAQQGSSADLHTYRRSGRGPAKRGLGHLLVTPEFEVIEVLESRPSIGHGNLRRDGGEKVWRSVLDTELPPMPEPDELAHLYGDVESDALHPGADSVYMMLCDKHWQEREVRRAIPKSDPRAMPG